MKKGSARLVICKTPCSLDPDFSHGKEDKRQEEARRGKKFNSAKKIKRSVGTFLNNLRDEAF